MHTPRNVFLFSGHMMDAPDRPQPRFPPAKETAAAARIAAALDVHGAGPEDVSFSQAAAGGDMLFLEACKQRGVRSSILLPFSESVFIQRSIEPSLNGADWRARFFRLKEGLNGAIRVMPDELGPLAKEVNPYERCNLWLLESALACGVERVRFITLWDGGGGDAPGGTAHMYKEVSERTGSVDWIDIRKL